MILIGLAVLNWLSTSSPRAIVPAPKINRQNVAPRPKRKIMPEASAKTTGGATGFRRFSKGLPCRICSWKTAPYLIAAGRLKHIELGGGGRNRTESLYRSEPNTLCFKTYYTLILRGFKPFLGPPLHRPLIAPLPPFQCSLGEDLGETISPAK
jgi:hypothetical protein